MHSLARQFPRYATTSKTRQGASLDESPVRRPESASFLQSRFLQNRLRINAFRAPILNRSESSWALPTHASLLQCGISIPAMSALGHKRRSVINVRFTPQSGHASGREHHLVLLVFVEQSFQAQRSGIES